MEAGFDTGGLACRNSTVETRQLDTSFLGISTTRLLPVIFSDYPQTPIKQARK